MSIALVAFIGMKVQRVLVTVKESLWILERRESKQVTRLGAVNILGLLENEKNDSQQKRESQRNREIKSLMEVSDVEIESSIYLPSLFS